MNTFIHLCSKITKITMGNDVARDIHCDVIAMSTYHGITMYSDIAINLFYSVLLCLFMLFYYQDYGFYVK